MEQERRRRRRPLGDVLRVAAQRQRVAIEVEAEGAGERRRHRQRGDERDAPRARAARERVPRGIAERERRAEGGEAVEVGPCNLQGHEPPQFVLVQAIGIAPAAFRSQDLQTPEQYRGAPQLIDTGVDPSIAENVWNSYDMMPLC